MLTDVPESNFKGGYGVAQTALTEVLTSLAQKRIKEALEKAIVKGEKPISGLMSAIGDDLENSFYQSKGSSRKNQSRLIKTIQSGNFKQSPK